MSFEMVYIKSEILKLPVSERIRIVQDIWDSIADCPESVTLTNTQRHELDRRLEEYKKNPNGKSPWAEVRARILGEL